MDNKLTRKQKLLLSLAISSFTALSIVFFAPIEVYLGNIIDFGFSLSSFWWILMLVSLGVIIVSTIIGTYLPELLSLMYNLVIFIIGLCCYIQANFLNGQMDSLAAGQQKFTSGITLPNIIIWVTVSLIVIIGVLILRKQKKLKVTTQVLEFVCMTLVVMQTVALITVLLSTNINSYKRVNYLSNEGEFELSKNNNVIEFIIDTCDDDLFLEPLMESNPEIFTELKGFTYYPNATSTYSRTYPAVPYLLTKEMCYFDKPYYQYIDEAYEESKYLPALKSTGADLRLFTDSQYLGTMGNKYFSNVKTNDGKLEPKAMISLVKKMLKVSLYRGSPYQVKDRFYYTSNEVNNVFAKRDQAIKEDEIQFYEYLTTNGLTINNEYSSTYRFYHLFGTHPGAFWDENLQRKNGATQEEALKGDFKLISEYLKQMQDLGIYEQSTIIITADHANSGGNPESLDLYRKARPIMMVKSAGKGIDSEYSVSSAPVSQNDLFPTILSALGSDNDDYGVAIDKVPLERNETRYYYYSTFFSDIDGEVALREYAINGDARNYDNWKETGRYWDINYSERAVSKHRMSEYTNEKPQKKPK